MRELEAGYQEPRGRRDEQTNCKANWTYYRLSYDDYHDVGRSENDAVAWRHSHSRAIDLFADSSKFGCGQEISLVKREIRDAVVAQMGEWVAELENPQSLDEARKVIREHSSEIEK